MDNNINDLLEEFSGPPFSKEDYLREKSELEKLIFDKYGIKAEDIEAAMRVHKIPHEELDLCDRWIENEAFVPYLDNASNPQWRRVSMTR